jgi:hypothetical protein
VLAACDGSAIRPRGRGIAQVIDGWASDPRPPGFLSVTGHQPRLVIADILGTPGRDHNEARWERACSRGLSPLGLTGRAIGPGKGRTAAACIEIRCSLAPGFRLADRAAILGGALRPQSAGADVWATYCERSNDL